MRVFLKSLSLCGFCSFRDPSYIDLSSNLYWIRGNNGAGKSTLINAISFCLYGRPPEGILVSDLVSHGSKNFRVELCLLAIDEQGRKTIYGIARQKKKEENDRRGISFGSWDEKDAIYKIEEDRQELLSANRGEVQEQIEKLIGIEQEVYNNVCAFRQKQAHLFKSPNSEIKRFMLSLLGISSVEEAKQYAKEALTAKRTSKSYQEGAKKLYALIRLLETEKERAEALREREEELQIQDTTYLHIKQQVKEIKRKQTSLMLEERAIMQNIAQKQELGALREEREAKKKELVSLQEQKESVKKEKAEKETALKIIGQQINKKEAQSTKEQCYACGQPLSKNEEMKAFKAMQEEIKELYSQQSQLTREIAVVAQNRGMCDAKENAIQKDVQHITQQIDNTTAETIEKHKRLSEVKSEMNEATASLCQKQVLTDAHEKKKAQVLDDKAKCEREMQQLSKTHDKLKTQIDAIEEEINLLSFCEKHLGSKGLQKHILSSSLRGVNDMMRHYGNIIGVKVEIDIDTSSKMGAFNLHFTDEAGTRKLKQLSGGELSIVNSLFMLALNRLLGKSCHLRFIIFDEAFDGLDDNNMERTLQMIQSATQKDTQAIIISHAKNIPDHVGTKIHIEKEKTQEGKYVSVANSL